MAIGSCYGAARVFNYVQRARSSLILTCITARDRQCTLKNALIIHCNAYSTDKKNAEPTIDGESDVKPKKKKVFIPRVTLLSEDNEVSIATMEMAQKIANRRNLKLVKILDFDTKTERPTYKLMTSKQYLQEGLEMKKMEKQERETSFRSEKVLSISTKISEHDLQTKLRSIVKFLTKRHEVRILISVNDNKEKAEAIFTQLQTVVKDLSPSIIKATSANNFKILLRPNLQAKSSEVCNNEANDSEENTSVTCGS